MSHAEVTVKLILTRHDHSKTLTDETLRELAKDHIEDVWVDLDGGGYVYKVEVAAVKVDASEVYE